MAEADSYAFRMGQAAAAQNAQASSNVIALRGTNPDQAAEANQISASTGLPADTVERNLPDVRAMASGQRDAQTVANSPQLSNFFAMPRNAAVAHDDVPAMSAMSTLLGTDTLTGQITHAGITAMSAQPSTVPFAARASNIRAQAQGDAAAIEAARPTSTPGSWWTGEAVSTMEGFRQAYHGAAMSVADALGLENVIPEEQAAYQASVDRTQAFTPRDMSRFGQSVYGGVQGVTQFVPALLATALTGPVGGIAVAGGQQGFSAYGKYRARGATPGQAAVGGGAEAGIGAVSAALPIGGLVARFGERGVAHFAANFLGRDLLGQEIQRNATDAVDTAVANPDATWDQYVRDRPGAILDAAVGAAVGTGVIGTAHHVVRSLAPVEQSARAATTAVAGANFLDTVMATAETSKLRERDPASFQQFVDQHTNGSPVENVYVPAERIRELMQSDAFDPRTWEEIAPNIHDQVSQASATDGDVVLPLSGVATHLAGTEAWDAIREDARLDPGGMSIREARDFNDAYADLMAKQGEDAAASARTEQEARAPEQKVYDSVFEQSRAAGFNVRASQAYADLWAQRYATRAERTGTDAWSAFQASKPSIVSDLPASVEGYRKADNLDVVINAMKRGAEERPPATDSLLQFISKGGGVEDKGGDIASMGGDKWHRE